MKAGVVAVLRMPGYCGQYLLKHFWQPVSCTEQSREYLCPLSHGVHILGGQWGQEWGGAISACKGSPKRQTSWVSAFGSARCSRRMNIDPWSCWEKKKNKKPEGMTTYSNLTKVGTGPSRGVADHTCMRRFCRYFGYLKPGVGKYIYSIYIVSIYIVVQSL